jgi:GntR family transcriptional repressor for pyruvate dehydrogenase complex
MKFHGLSLRGAFPQLNEVFHEHTAICRAIAEGDGDKAYALMHDHLTGSRDRLFEGRLLDLSMADEAEQGAGNNAA